MNNITLTPIETERIGEITREEMNVEFAKMLWKPYEDAIKLWVYEQMKKMEDSDE